MSAYPGVVSSARSSRRDPDSPADAREVGDARDARPASPLLVAALALVPPSATATGLERRFARSGADLHPGAAARLLAELAELGLVRVARSECGTARYVLTTLGQRYAEAGPDGAGVPLRELEVLRTELLSTIAHELRTPLTAVRTSAGLLLDPDAHPSEAQRQQLLEAIARNGERMNRLVGDILELSRFRSGSVSLQLRRFAAIGLADAALAVVAPLANGRGQRLERIAKVPQDHAVYGDHRRLEQALLNLVSNAQRFAPEGGSVTVRVEERGTDTAWSVVDDGPGIPADERAMLFERFFVGRNDRNAAREGVGLGLPTALAIAQAHGGTIEVVSEPGRGSTFTLVVPTAGPADEP